MTVIVSHIGLQLIRVYFLVALETVPFIDPQSSSKACSLNLQSKCLLLTLQVRAFPIVPRFTLEDKRASKRVAFR